MPRARSLPFGRPGAVGVAAALVLAACTAGTESAPRSDGIEPIEASAPDPTPVILDYSPTVSDVGALMYLVAHPRVEVIAVSLPATGEAGCELGVEVTLRILAMLGSDAPVACDPEVPSGARSWPPEFLAGHENLLFGLPEATASPSGLTGPGLIAEAAAEAERPPILVAVAPLTNVAKALELRPDLGDHLERIIIMGGAVDAPGNVEGIRAEWNLWIDADAAADVVASGVPITLVPLDATNDVPAPQYRRILSAAPQTEAVVYLGRLVRLFPAVNSGFFYLWDELAASVVAGEEHVTTEEMAISVVSTGIDAGTTIRDEAGAMLTVATGVPDPSGFYAEYLGALAGATVDVGRSATPEEVTYFRAVENSLVELEAAGEAIFGGSSLPGEEGSEMSLTEAISLFLGAIVASHAVVAELDPPPSLQEIHENYLLVFGVIVEAQEEILTAAANATTFEDMEGVVEVDLADACGPMNAEANWLHVDIDLSC